MGGSSSQEVTKCKVDINSGKELCYLRKCGDGGRKIKVKIGKTKNLRARDNQHSTMDPEGEMIVVCYNDVGDNLPSLETTLKREYRDKFLKRKSGKQSEVLILSAHEYYALLNRFLDLDNHILNDAEVNRYRRQDNNTCLLM